MTRISLLGFLVPPWVKIAAYLIFIVSILSSVYFLLHKAYTWAYTNGATATTAQWTARENVQLVTANIKITQLEDEARQKEREQDIKTNLIVDTYEKDKQNAKAQNDIIIANLNSGVIKLRDKYAASSQSSCPSTTGATSADTSSNSEKTGTELSEKAADFLLGLVTEADEVVYQLQACQALLVVDRQTCNATHILDKPVAQ